MDTNNFPKIVIVINNYEGYVLPNETFLQAHIDRLPNTVPLIGIPGRRFLSKEHPRSIPSRAIGLLVIRWLIRRIGASTVFTQDRRALARFLRDRRIGVVLAEYGPTAVSVMDACRDASVPLVAHFHGFDAYKNDIISTYGEEYRKLFDQAAAVVAVSMDMREQLLLLGAKGERTYLNPCGADIPEGLVAHPESSAIRFLMVGRLVDKKAPHLSIRAFSKVLDRLPQSRLDIIGDGPLLGVCQQTARALGISDRVSFLGSRVHSEVIASMLNTRCFIQHSVCAPDGDREGTPVAVLEAMGVGLPVVATRHGGIKDIIQDGRTGTLVDEHDVDGMAEAMLRYARDPGLAKKIGMEARSAIQTNWTSEKSTRRLMGIIEQAILSAK